MKYIISFFLVFGFLQDSFTGQEQRQSHRIQVGYRKGAASAQTNLLVNVQHTEGTAGEYTYGCYKNCRKLN